MSYNYKVMEGDTPLHLAVKHNCLRSVWIIMKSKVDLNAKNSIQETPLHLAAKNHNLEIFEQIYRFGGDLKSIDSDGKTPLYYLTLREKVLFQKFQDRFHGTGKYEYKPKPETPHWFGATKEMK